MKSEIGVKKMECKKCKYFYDDGTDYKKCRRFPPSAVCYADVDGDVYSDFCLPVTKEESFCGEFSDKELGEFKIEGKTFYKKENKNVDR